MIGQLLGRVLGVAGRTVVRAAVAAATAELRKPETQEKLGAAVAAAGAALRDPEKRAELERTAGTARDGAARALGRAAGAIRNKLASPAEPPPPPKKEDGVP